MNFPYNILKLPEACLLEKRVYKKLFYENTDFSVTDKKWFAHDIDGLSWQYTLKPDLTGMKAVQEEHYAYEEIAILDIEISSFEHVRRLADIIHRSIPYPLLVVFRQTDAVCFSLADKRYNLADDQAATLQKLWVTEPLVEEELKGYEQHFLEQLSYSEQPQLHLKAFYKGWESAFYAYDIAKVTGTFEMETEQEKKVRRRSALDEYRKIDDNIAELRADLKKETAFSRKMELNVEIKQAQDQLNEISKQL